MSCGPLTAAALLFPLCAVWRSPGLCRLQESRSRARRRHRELCIAPPICEQPFSCMSASGGPESFILSPRTRHTVFARMFLAGFTFALAFRPRARAEALSNPSSIAPHTLANRFSEARQVLAIKAERAAAQAPPPQPRTAPANTPQYRTTRVNNRDVVHID